MHFSVDKRQSFPVAHLKLFCVYIVLKIGVSLSAKANKKEYQLDTMANLCAIMMPYDLRLYFGGRYSKIAFN